MTFRFDPVRHEYWLGDRLLPSVTQIISPLYDWKYVKPADLEYAGIRGDAVHFGCELLDRGTLNWATVQPEILGYIHAWEKYRREVPHAWEFIEQPAYHSLLMYAGTPDRYGIVRGRPALVDIKTVAAMNPAVGVQLAGYRNLIAPGHDAAREIDRIAVQLCADGTYREHHYKSRDDVGCFLGLLATHNWRRKHGS